MADSEKLEQSDLETLISAVEQGDAASDQPTARIFSRFRRDQEKVEIRPYDFKRPERISKDQMRALETLHEAFARSFGAQLSGFLRRIVEFKIANAEQMTYSEFIGSLPNPTSFTLVKGASLDGLFCIELSPLIIYPIIERLLGGTNEELTIPQRPLTLIEARLVTRILGLGMNALEEAWSGVKPIEFEIDSMESNPNLVQIVAPNEVVVVIGFEIKFGERAGTMSLCMPYNVIEGVMDDLNSENWLLAGQRREADAVEPAIIERLADSAVQLEATLAETSITLSELGALEVGDLIVTDRPSAGPVTLSVEGQPKFDGFLGAHRGMRAVQIRADTLAEASLEPIVDAFSASETTIQAPSD
jgi:flagellar motor switch protein FliM